MIEIRWHGRGGQGAVSATKILASAAISEGKYAQSAPDYGAERSGAPLKAYNRLSEKPITLHCLVLHPNIVVIIDPTLLGSVNFLKGTNKDTVLVVNTTLSPKELREKYNINGMKIYTIDATKIAMDKLGKPLVNIPMLGALSRITEDLVSFETIEKNVNKMFSKKLSKEMLEANIAALHKAYKEVMDE